MAASTARLSDGRYWAPALLLPASLLIAGIVLGPALYGISLSFREMWLHPA